VPFQFVRPLEGVLGFLALWVRARISSWFMFIYMALPGIRSETGDILLAFRAFR
jgi:hypothetical protein